MIAVVPKSVRAASALSIEEKKPCTLGNCAYCLYAGSVVEEGLRWDVKVNSSDSARQVNKSLAAMLVLRSDSPTTVV